jgi:glyoxylase-like metal-dependent hydrolase (beta-lactamase superfamily II)
VSDDAKIREVLPGIHLLHLPLPMKPTIVNVYLVDGGDEWALVDTGMSSADSIATFHAALAQLGLTPERIRKIICTHHHPDHFGTSKAYKELTGATLYLHPAEYERAKGFLPSDRPAEAVRFFLAHGLPLARFVNVPRPSDIWGGLYVTTAPDRPLADGDVIEIGHRRVEIVWTPGHAPGHCVLFFPKERAMIVGDHLLPKITPHVGFGPGTTGNPLADFIASQEKVQRFRRRHGPAGTRWAVPRPPSSRQPDHPAPPSAVAGHPRHRAPHAAPRLRRRPPRLRVRQRQPAHLPVPGDVRDARPPRVSAPRGRRGQRGTRRADLLARGVSRAPAAHPRR